MAFFARIRAALDSMIRRDIVFFMFLLFALVALLKLTEQTPQEMEASRTHWVESERARFEIEKLQLEVDKARKEAGLNGYGQTSVLSLKDLVELFLRAAPMGLAVFSFVRAWQVFSDNTSSRLRICLAVTFAVATIGFALIVGGFTAQSHLEASIPGTDIKVSTASIGLMTIVVSALFFIASLLSLKPKSRERIADAKPDVA